MLALVVGMFCLTKWMNASIESEKTPVPLFLLALRIVSQMFPVRCSWLVLVGRMVVCSASRFAGYSRSTIGWLSSVMVAILLKVHARVNAVL